MFKEGATAAQLLDMECGMCKVERMRRNRLLGHGSNAHLQPEFAEAPYIHPFHTPKTVVFLLHAVHFAQSKNQQLLWCTSVDVPLSRDDEAKSADSLRASRRRWLTYTEAKTAGLCGVLPLSIGLPIRSTDTIDLTTEHASMRRQSCLAGCLMRQLLTLLKLR